MNELSTYPLFVETIGHHLYAVGQPRGRMTKFVYWKDTVADKLLWKLFCFEITEQIKCTTMK